MIAPFGETVQRDDESCPWGKLLQLSEKAEDSRRPKKCLAKQSAAAQRKRCCKRCRAASLADASPRLARGRSENIWIRLTRQRRDLGKNRRHVGAVVGEDLKTRCFSSFSTADLFVGHAQEKLLQFCTIYVTTVTL